MYDKVYWFAPGRNPNGQVLLPDGTYLNIAGSTTSGWQEAINWACDSAHSYDMEFFGGDEVTGGAITALCTTPIQFPPMQGKSIKIGAITLGSPNNGTFGGAPLLSFESCMMVSVRAEGFQLDSAGTGSGLCFKPTLPLPQDHQVGGPVIIDSQFDFTTIGANGSYAIVLDATSPGNVGIGHCRFSVGEINAAAISVYVKPPIAGANVSNNRFTCEHMHGASNTALYLGGPGMLGGWKNNKWFVDISTQSGTVRGIDTYGSGDTFLGSIDGPISACGILLESSAKNNKFIMNGIDGGVQTQPGATGNVFL